MQKIKKLQGMILALVFVFVASLVTLPSNTAFAAKKSAVPKIKVTGLSKTYTLDQQPGALKAICTGTTKYVQYKVLLTDTKTRKVTVLTKGYTSKISPKKAYSFRLPVLKAGQYQIRVYARTYGSKASYQSFYSQYVMMYNNVNLTKNGQVYGGKTMTINGNVYVKANNVTLNNLKVNGTLYLDPGKDGSANLNNVQATSIKVLSGGVNSIHLNDVITKLLQVVAKENVRIESKGNTQIAATNVYASAILQVVAGSFGDVTVNDNAVKANTTLELRGAFDKAVTVLSSSTVKAADGAVVPSVVLNPENSTDKIVLVGFFKAAQVNKDANLEVASGKVDSIIAKAKIVLVVDKAAVVTDVTSNGNDVKVSGDGSSTTKVDGKTVNPTPTPTPTPGPSTSTEKANLDSFIQKAISLVTGSTAIQNNGIFTIGSNGNVTINTSTKSVEDAVNTLISKIQAKGALTPEYATALNKAFNDADITVGGQTLSKYIANKLSTKTNCTEIVNFFNALDTYGKDTSVKASYDSLVANYDTLKAKVTSYNDLLTIVKGVVTADKQITIPAASVKGFALQSAKIQKGTNSITLTPNSTVSVSQLVALVNPSATKVGTLTAGDFKGTSVTITLKHSTTGEIVSYTYSIN